MLGIVASVLTTVAALRRRTASVDIVALLALVGALVVEESFCRCDDHRDVTQVRVERTTEIELHSEHGKRLILRT